MLLDGQAVDLAIRRSARAQNIALRIDPAKQTPELVLPPRTTAGLTTLWAMPRPIAQALARALSPTATAQ